jgi:phosphoadenosine phosphosulfate reductase
VDDLAALAHQADRDLAQAPAVEVIRWAVGTFGARFCVTTSFADPVLVHLASRVAPGVDVVFLDTGLHFAETLAVRELVAKTMHVRVRSIEPSLTVPEQASRYGDRLYARDPDRCCALRKVEPLSRVLVDYDAWAAGLRRDESPSRADAPVVHMSNGRVKVNPIVRWTQSDVDDYIERHRLPVNPLLRQGYRSIGCQPCTRPVTPGEDPRAGRWPLFDKTECGLHGSAGRPARDRSAGPTHG